MKKVLKKILLGFSILLLVFNLVYKPKIVKADAGVASFGGMALVAVNPEIWPVVLIGLAAALLLGYTITNWDEISAFGAAVVEQLEAAGHSVGEFVSGTSVIINPAFKEAAKKAALGNKTSISRYVDKNSYTYSNGFKVLLGTYKIASGYPLILSSGRSVFLGDMAQGKYFGNNTKYNQAIDFLGTSLTVVVNLSSLSSKFEPTLYSSGVSLQGTHGQLNVEKDSSGNVIQVSRSFLNTKKVVPVDLRFAVKNSADVTITHVSIPELGIDVGTTVPVNDLKMGAVSETKINDYIGTAFPAETTTVKFDPEARVDGTTLASIPTVSNMTLTANQVNELRRIREGTVVGVQAGATTLTGANSTTATNVSTGVGWDWLSKLWEWLKKLLEAILGLPAAILSGLQSLWDSLIKWLTDIWAAITAIPAAISKAFTDAVTWTFAVDGAWLNGRIIDLKSKFDVKFPAITAINYHFTDKDTFDDLTVFIPNVGEVVIVQGSMVMRYSPVLKRFLSAFFYLITALFFFRRFYKVAED